MNPRKKILLVDFSVNLILGILLLAYSEKLADFLGVPFVDSSFYPNILGGIFIGIALALLIEITNKSNRNTSGLGLLGAIAINFCGGIVLIFWLLSGKLKLPIHGSVFLWLLAFILVILSSYELINHLRAKK
jgi:peptidoglycan/LPS O-acetylase OafA/YrhL